MSFYTYVLCLHTPIYNAKCTNSMLKVSLSYWTPMIRNTCSTILLKFRCKAHLKMCNLSLSLRTGPCQFHIWLRSLDWLRLASRFLSMLTGTSCQQQLDRELCDAYLLWEDSEGEEFFVSPDFSAWFLQVIVRESYIATCTAGHWRWRFRWPAYISKSNASSFNCSCFVILYIL